MVLPLIALGLMAAGSGASMYGNHKGAAALEAEKKRSLRRDTELDSERQAQLGSYIDSTYGTPVGATDEAYAADSSMTAGNAMGAPVADVAGSSLGVMPAPGGGISPNSRVAGRQGATGQRMANGNIRRARLGSNLDDIERRRSMNDMVEPSLEAQAAKSGGDFRQLGGYLSAAGSMYGNYQMAYPSGGGQGTPISAQGGSNAVNGETSRRVTGDLYDRNWLGVR